VIRVGDEELELVNVVGVEQKIEEGDGIRAAGHRHHGEA
jgi:hypothetical protein